MYLEAIPWSIGVTEGGTELHPRSIPRAKSGFGAAGREVFPARPTWIFRKLRPASNYVNANL